MIIEKLNVIFIHIPKAAGHSVETELCKKINIYDIKTMSKLNKKMYNLNYHATYKTYFNTIQNIDKYYIFTVVRNPYTRIWSLYNYQISKNYKINNTYCNFGEYIKSENKYIGTYEKFVIFIDFIYDLYKKLCAKYDFSIITNYEKAVNDCDRYGYILFIETQSHYLMNNQNKININKIIKYETLNEDWKEIKEKFNIGD